MYIQDICDIKEQKGEVGIEIEVEGKDLPESIVGWKREHDGSLRGDCCEFVLRQPCVRDRVPLYLDRVYKAYEDNNTTVYPSSRQSVHVHINVQDINLTKVFNMMVTFIIFEELLVDYCGEGRTGNLFCLRAKDAEFIISELERAAISTNLHPLGRSDLRYSAINPVALFKYGSLEFRSMRGGTDQETLQTWVNMLLAIKDYAKLKDNPVEIMSDYQVMGPEGLLDFVFKDNASVLKVANYNRSIISSARSVKMLSYSGNWESLSKVEEVVEELDLEEPDTPPYDVPFSAPPINPEEIDRVLERIRSRQAGDNILWTLPEEEEVEGEAGDESEERYGG